MHRLARGPEFAVLAIVGGRKILDRLTIVLKSQISLLVLRILNDAERSKTEEGGEDLLDRLYFT